MLGEPDAHTLRLWEANVATHELGHAIAACAEKVHVNGFGRPLGLSEEALGATVHGTPEDPAFDALDSRREPYYEPTRLVSNRAAHQ